MSELKSAMNNKRFERIKPDFSEPRKELEIKPADCMVFFGRGIEKVAMGGDKWIWKPARYIQRLEKKSGQDKVIRTAVRSTEEPLQEFESEDNVQEMVGGGTASVIAAAHAYELLQQRGQAPKEIIISGGRPKYLEKEESELSEAKIMKREFLHKLKADSAVLETGVTLLEQSKNTQDDLVNSLLLCHSRGYRKVLLVNASIAMARTQAFYEVIRDDPHHPNSAVFREMDIQFIGADDLLEQRQGDRFHKIKAKLVDTAAYRRTVEDEGIGEEKARRNEYGQGDRGKGNY